MPSRAVRFRLPGRTTFDCMAMRMFRASKNLKIRDVVIHAIPVKVMD
jgi:hypothetical protein